MKRDRSLFLEFINLSRTDCTSLISDSDAIVVAERKNKEDERLMRLKLNNGGFHWRIGKRENWG